MLEICPDKDATLLTLAEQRGLLSRLDAEHIRTNRGRRSAAVALVEEGLLDSTVVRALRMELGRRTIDHAIDGYELLGRLGSGGMSEVFQATDLVTHKQVAFKVISPQVAGDGLFLQRFHREARAAAAVVHPNVIACYGLGETKGKAYMVLEYMPGGDLEALVKRHGGALSEARVVQIALDCAKGLEAIHAHGLVHRDIKPSNILLDEHGNAKLADLGLAKSSAIDDQLTMPGIRVGSPGYISPEQASGQTGLDIRSDIFSLGSTLYFLLTGTCAFTGRSPFEVIVKCMREEAPQLKLVAPHVLPRLAAIVTKCMARRLEDRYRDPSALRQQLQTVGGLQAGTVTSSVPGQPSTGSMFRTSLAGVRHAAERCRTWMQRLWR